MISEKRKNELKRAVATFIVRTPYPETKEWFELYNEFVHSDKKYVDERFDTVSEADYNEISYLVMKMIQDAQHKRNKVITD